MGGVFVWFWYQVDGDFIECFWKCSLLFSFFEEFKKDQCKFLFVCVVEFTCEAISSWTFVCRVLLNYRFHFTSSDWYVQIIYFFLSQNLSISSRLSHLLTGKRKIFKWKWKYKEWDKSFLWFNDHLNFQICKIAT